MVSNLFREVCSLAYHSFRSALKVKVPLTLFWTQIGIIINKMQIILYSVK